MHTRRCQRAQTLGGLICFLVSLGDIIITGTSTERQKRSQNLAPVLVIISGNSLVFSRKIINSSGFYRCCAPGASAPVVVKNQSPSPFAPTHLGAKQNPPPRMFERPDRAKRTERGQMRSESKAPLFISTCAGTKSGGDHVWRVWEHCV